MHADIEESRGHSGHFAVAAVLISAKRILPTGLRDRTVTVTYNCKLQTVHRGTVGSRSSTRQTRATELHSLLLCCGLQHTGTVVSRSSTRQTRATERHSLLLCCGLQHRGTVGSRSSTQQSAIPSYSVVAFSTQGQLDRGAPRDRQQQSSIPSYSVVAFSTQGQLDRGAPRDRGELQIAILSYSAVALSASRQWLTAILHIRGSVSCLYSVQRVPQMSALDASEHKWNMDSVPIT
jgi:hypothetical protein